MEVLLSQIIAGAAALAFIVKLLNWAYLRPKRLERALRKQGLNGNPYRLVVGDLKEFMKTVEEAKSITINLDDDIKQRVTPFVSKIVSKFAAATPSPPPTHRHRHRTHRSAATRRSSTPVAAPPPLSQPHPVAAPPPPSQPHPRRSPATPVADYNGY